MTNRTRPRGPQDLAHILARSVLCIIVDVQRDWLDGNRVALCDIRHAVEALLRDELVLIEERMLGEFRNPPQQLDMFEQEGR
jgi:hypothetical protein